MADYTCSYRQLFNTFGAPGIPNTYRATLRLDGRKVTERDYHWRRRAENQCLRWVQMYNARMEDDW